MVIHSPFEIALADSEEPYQPDPKREMELTNQEEASHICLIQLHFLFRVPRKEWLEQTSLHRANQTPEFFHNRDQEEMARVDKLGLTKRVDWKIQSLTASPLLIPAYYGLLHNREEKRVPVLLSIHPMPPHIQHNHLHHQIKNPFLMVADLRTENWNSILGKETQICLMAADNLEMMAADNVELVQ